MTIFELASELGKALKNDEKLVRLADARKNYENDPDLQKMMVEYRANPPQEILGSKVVEIYDYKTLELKNTVSVILAKEKLLFSRSQLVKVQLENSAKYASMRESLHSENSQFSNLA